MAAELKICCNVTSDAHIERYRWGWAGGQFWALANNTRRMTPHLIKSDAPFKSYCKSKILVDFTK